MIKIAFVLPVLMLWLTSCSSSRVFAEFTGTGDYSQVHTYQIVDDGKKFNPDQQTSSSSDQLISSYIKKQMDFRGFTADKNPDLIVHYRFVLDNKTDARVNDPTWNTYRYNPMGTVDLIHYQDGLLIIDIRDSRTGKSIFQGSSDIRKKGRQKNDPLNAAISQIFESFPLKAG